MATSIEVNYARSHGVHDFSINSGEIVTVLSQPKWEDFVAMLASASALGDLALTPELITSPQKVSDTPWMAGIISERIAEVREHSLAHAGTTLGLGTATFDNGFGRPANSLLFISNGEITAQINKAFSFNPLEKQIFTLRQTVGTQQKLPARLAGLVCSDLLGQGCSDITRKLLLDGSDELTPKDAVADETEVVLVSCTWAVPVRDPKVYDVVGSEGLSFRRSLETRVGSLFRRNPAIMDVVIADRTGPMTERDEPYNAHFSRAVPAIF